MPDSHMSPKVDAEGPGAPPRRNGELVFQAPWEGRAFGLAVALGDEGLFPWEAFRTRLIAAIAASDGRPEGERLAYYESWLGALQKFLVERGILTTAEIEDRMRQFATGQRDIVHPGAP
ncbi:MAG TPA: nitrile hydratase accessory protein [bacterium]